MLNNYKDFIKDIEADKRTRYGVSISILRKYNKTANPAADNNSYYDASTDPSVEPYLYDTETITFNAVVDYATEEDIEKLKAGIVEVGDAKLDIAISRKALIKESIKENFAVTIDSDEYLIVDSSSHTLETLLIAYVQRKK